MYVRNGTHNQPFVASTAKIWVIVSAHDSMPPHLAMPRPCMELAAAVRGNDGRVWNYFALLMVRGRIQWSPHVRLRARRIIPASYPFEHLLTLADASVA